MLTHDESRNLNIDSGEKEGGGWPSLAQGKEKFPSSSDNFLAFQQHVVAVGNPLASVRKSLEPVP